MDKALLGKMGLKDIDATHHLGNDVLAERNCRYASVPICKSKIEYII